MFACARVRVYVYVCARVRVCLHCMFVSVYILGDIPEDDGTTGYLIAR